MRLVLTLLARNEADIVAENLAFHLNAGVDLVIATDNRSEDGTTEILEEYERSGQLHLLREEGADMRQGKWVTRMARLAAAEFAADWVIHGDADEFYWPRGGDLKDVLAAVPRRYGSVRTFVRTFLLRPGNEGSFAERMTVRLSTQAPINDPASIFRPGAKLIHRAHPDVVIGDGTHTLRGASFPLLRGYNPIELLHYPFRTIEQTKTKFLRAWDAWSASPLRPPPHYYAKAYAAIQDGRIDEFLASLTVDERTLEEGLASGSLVVDERVRDALRQVRADETALRFTPPDLDEEMRYGVETAVLEEGDVVRLRRATDELEARLALLERGG